MLNSELRLEQLICSYVVRSIYMLPSIGKINEYTDYPDKDHCS